MTTTEEKLLNKVKLASKVVLKEDFSETTPTEEKLLKEKRKEVIN